MPIQIGAKGATIAGVNYPPYAYVDWLSPSAEALAVQGGDAVMVPARQLSASQVAAVAAGRRRGIVSANAPSIGTRLPAGAMLGVTVASNPTFFDATWQVTCRLAARAFAVRLVFAGFAASQTASLKAAISSPADLTVDANNSAGTWVNMTFAGVSTGTIPAWQNSKRPTLYFSDWTEIDCSNKQLVARAYIPSAGNTEAGVSDFTQNSTDTNGRALWGTVTGDEWINRRQSVDGVGAPTGFTSTAFQNFNLIYAVQYLTSDGVITVGGCGDSIMAGTYSTQAYNSHWVRAIRALKIAGYAVESANLAWQGQKTYEYYPRALDAIDNLSLSHLIYSPWSPNDGVDNPTTAIVNRMRSGWSRVLYEGALKGCNVIPITGQAKGAGAYNVSAWTDPEDDLRRLLNAEVRSATIYLDPDIVVCNRNTAGLAAGVFVDPSYVETTSYIHLTEAGNAVAAPSMQTVLAALLA